VVPLFGDMQFTLEAMIRSSPNFDDRSWATPVDEARLAMDYSLTSALGSIRQNHDTFIATYSLMLHEVCILATLREHVLRLFCVVVCDNLMCVGVFEEKRTKKKTTMQSRIRDVFSSSSSSFLTFLLLLFVLCSSLSFSLSLSLSL
jgi:hypothetical protein